MGQDTENDAPLADERIDEDIAGPPALEEVEEEPVVEPEAVEAADEPADDLDAAIAEAGVNLDEEPAAAEPAETSEPEDVAEGEAEEPETAEEPEEEPAGEPESVGDESAEAEQAVAETATEQPAEPAPVRTKVSIWPFLIYDLLWLAFAGVIVWRFLELPADQAVFESTLYPIAVYVGVGLTAAGPLLILMTWLFSWGRDGAPKGALFMSSLVKGAVATTAGVAMWWVALMVLDQMRLGRFL